MANKMMDVFKKKVDQLQEDNPTPEESSADGHGMPDGGGMKDPEMPEEKSPKEDKARVKELVKACKEAYSTFVSEAKSDPEGALQNLIDSLEGLKGGGASEDMGKDEPPLNMMPPNMM
jgi:hypothetical protein